MVGLLDLPQEVQKQLGRNPSGSVVVRRFYIEDLKVIKPGRLQHLAENHVDKYYTAIQIKLALLMT